MRRWAAATGIVVIAAVRSACAAGFLAPQPRSTAVPVDAVVCADSLGDVPLPEPGLPPEGFDAVAVVRCDAYASETDAEGVWAGVATERFEGELSPLLAAISAPNDARWPGPCTADMVLVPDLWLVTADGEAVRLSYPADGCGKAKGKGVSEALSRLSMVERAFERHALVESRAAAASGCSTRASVLVVAGGIGEQRLVTEPAEPGASAASGAIAVAPPRLPDAHDVTGVRLCAYAADELGDGAFVRGADLDAGTARATLELIATAEPAPACDAAATSFVTLTFAPAASAALPIVLELDGCGRLIDHALRALVAPPGLVDLVAPTP